MIDITGMPTNENANVHWGSDAAGPTRVDIGHRDNG